ncbi:hypothetical protein [Cohnella sp. AR92]|uniref:hypothetical protein n=1 Tax=Cohnella sp. AR92 TaxID=648716 RepID=UPI000F8DB12F|nr:hypothetical protein [Cohnella sp. AR92]RUS43555.1 hypothetical protein ELR57_24815 [Cohnella sp. AR92]
MDFEALSWEIVRVERVLFAYSTIKESVQQAMKAMCQEDAEASMTILRSIQKMENDQQERKLRLELEQVRKGRALGLLPISTEQSESMSEWSFDMVQNVSENGRSGLTGFDIFEDEEFIDGYI